MVAEEIKIFRSARNLAISLMRPSRMSVCSVRSWAYWAQGNKATRKKGREGKGTVAAACA
jgi:hypothetical protein